MSAIGGSTISIANNTGRIFMRLKPHNQRKLSADEIIQELRPKVAKVPGIQMFMQNLPSIRIGGQLTKSQYQYTLQSPDTQELYRYATEFEAKLRGLPQLQDVTSDLQIKNPQVNVEIDRDKASALGLSAQQVEDALYYAYGSRQVSTIYAPNNQYQVILELDAALPDGTFLPGHALYPLQQRAAGTAEHRGVHHQEPRPADGEPPGAAPGGHHLLQPQTGDRPRRCGAARRQAGPRPACPRPSARASRGRPRRSRPR